MDYKFENKTIKELLTVAYQEYGIPDDGGQANGYVKVELSKKIYLFIPNFQARKDVVMKHDAHHVLTATPFTLIGETEIAMWEITAGCWRHWFAFLINCTTIPIGFVFNLRKMFRAAVRGRRSQSLYDNRYSDEEFLNMKATDLYNELQLNDPTLDEKAQFIDYLTFAGWLLVCSLANILIIFTLPFLLLYNIYVFTLIRPQFT